MLSVNTNVTSLVVQNHFTLANDCVRTSLERLSTGFKINRAADDAANMAVSKNMECQISGTEVAIDNVQQAINLVQTADAAMGGMQDIAQRIRELALQAANDTYSNEERKMIQQEVSSLVDEIYKQRNNAKFNEIFIFGEQELPPHATGNAAGQPTLSATPSPQPSPPGEGANATIAGVSTPPQLTNGANAAAVGAFNPTHIYKTDQEAIDAGYTADHLIHNEQELQHIIDTQKKHWSSPDEEWLPSFDYLEGKYCLMGDIDFSKISGWGNMALGAFDEDIWETVATGDFNGNGYTISNLTINDSVNSDAHGLFYQVVGSVENLNIDNVNIVSNKINIGALAGIMYDSFSTITNCSASGSVTGKNYTGGLVGSAEGSITNSSATGSVTGNYYTGGLVGSAVNASITNSSATGSVTGNNQTGGLVGYSGGSITNSSASGSVKGKDRTGGLVGSAYYGSITQSYATGDVEGTDRVGGLVGYQYGNISNSYALGDVSGNSNVGGFIGMNSINSGSEKIENSYSTGNVTGIGDNIGGFVGCNEDEYGSGNIQNCYSTSDMKFNGANNGNVTNAHGAGEQAGQTGVTGHEPEWFNDGENLKSVLGDGFDYSVIPPDINGNKRPVPPPPPPPPPPTGEGIQFQIGANSGEENTLTINTNFSLNGFDADVTTREDALATVDKVDALIGEFSTMRSALGAAQNRLESVMDSLTTKNNNLSASHSTIVDTDFALESANLVKAQILQNATAALLAQANTAPDIALRLLQ